MEEKYSPFHDQRYSGNSDSAPNTNDSTLLASLPENAKKYYTMSNVNNIRDVLTNMNEISGCIFNPFPYIFIYPFFRLTFIDDNKMSKAIIGGKYYLIKGPGMRTVTGINDSLSDPNDLNEEVRHGPIKLIHVPPGCIQYALNTLKSTPLLLGPGTHYFNNPNIEVSNTSKEIDSKGENKVIYVNNNKTLTFVFVKPGFKGIVNERNGDLRIIEPGLHFIEAPDSFVRFVSIQQEHFKFGSCDKNKPVFLTADNVELIVNATLFYNVSDVKKLYTTSIKSEDDLFETLHSQAIATLITIIRSENFSSVGKKEMTQNMANKKVLKEHMQSDYEEHDPIHVEATLLDMDDVNTQPSAPPADTKSLQTLTDVSTGFQNIIHDTEPKFKEIMQTSFGDKIGFEIQSLRIEKIEFADQTMHKQVSELAMTFTKLAAQESTIVAQKKVQLAEADREASTKIIQIKAEAEQKRLSQDTANDILKSKARAEAEASNLKAETDAKNKLTLAKAEAQSIIEIGNAEVEITEKKNKLPNAQLRIVTEAQEKSLAGVNKVVYCDKMPSIVQFDNDRLLTLNTSDN